MSWANWTRLLIHLREALVGRPENFFLANVNLFSGTLYNIDCGKKAVGISYQKHYNEKTIKKILVWNLGVSHSFSILILKTLRPCKKLKPYLKLARCVDSTTSRLNISVIALSEFQTIHSYLIISIRSATLTRICYFVLLAIKQICKLNPMRLIGKFKRYVKTNICDPAE